MSCFGLARTASTSIDDICERAGVKKGSFYYFFDSKCALAVAALETGFQKKREEMDSLFSPTIPPLERIRKHCELSYRHQVELKAKFGQVLGCPLFTLGSEICTQDQKLRAKIQEILDYHGKYFESAIRDAHSAGLVDAPDAAAKARMIGAFYEGLLTRWPASRTNVEVLRELAGGIFSMLGVKEPAPA